jgi:hypothetical protein
MSSSTQVASEPAVAAPPAVTHPGRPAWQRLLTFDNRYLAPILITLILFFANWFYGNLDNPDAPWMAWLTGGRITTFSPTFAAMLAAMATELVLSRAFRGKWPHLASAYISGISAGILVRGPLLWPFVLCAMISIASKYALRIGPRHLWNPTNFGMTVMLFLAGDAMATLSVQTGNSYWAPIVIWIAGALILGRLRRLHIPLAFAAAYFPLAYVRTLFTGDTYLAELAPLLSPMYQLYMCFMITDPPTTTRTVRSRCLVAVLVAVAETILRLNGDVHAPYHALFIVGPAANLVEIGVDACRKQAKLAMAVA